jgi:signal transduction histidine kinase
MKRILTILMATLLASATRAEPLDEMALPDLEQRRDQIGIRLKQLANYSLGGGIGAIGYRSSAHTNSDHREWIEINFEREGPLDEVVLVPAIRRDTENGFQADGFPSHFRLIAGTGEDREGRVIAEYTNNDKVLPRIAPFSIPCDGIVVSWIRIETTQLSLRAFDERYVFQLSEILAFSSEENVALHQLVKATSNMDAGNPGWDEQYVVDGFMPYLMDGADGKKSVAYLTPPRIQDHPSLTIDLGQSHPLSRIHLHSVDQSDTLPQAFIGDFGTPKRMIIEGANRADFSDAATLLDIHHETIYTTGPVMMHAFPETESRYIRFKILEPALTALYGNIPSQSGFAEIEILSKGRNVALGKPTTASFELTTPNRPLFNLTDGLNMYGRILPPREWMNQLTLRHALETEIPLLQKELSHRYDRQKNNLRRLGWLFALLAAGTIIMVLVDRMIRQRAVFRTRERIAADLHDELGANLHAIGLLGDLAQAAKATPDKLDKLLQRMRALTERTGAAARYCTNLLEAKGLYEDLVEDMRRTSARIMADLDHAITFEGEEILQQLKPRKRIDLFLFYKECLINIIRHSGATQATTKLTATHKETRLVITDNGHGLNGDVPSSLKRRARLLGAQVETKHPKDGGICITLKLKPKKFGAF